MASVAEMAGARLYAEHQVSTGHEAGGVSWFCSCGRAGRAGSSANYPTERQALARADRHLQGARRRIQREIEAAIDLGGCGESWTDPEGAVHVCEDHNPHLLFVHSDGRGTIWSVDGRYEDSVRGVIG